MIKLLQYNVVPYSSFGLRGGPGFLCSKTDNGTRHMIRVTVEAYEEQRIESEDLLHD